MRFQRLGALALLILLSGLAACSDGGNPSSDQIAMPNCDRQGDQQSTIRDDGCIKQTARNYGYDGIAENSFLFAYLDCHNRDYQDLVEEYGGGSDDPTVIARTFSNRLFDNDESEQAGFDACLLGLSDAEVS